jgi:hypothetical protein
MRKFEALLEAHNTLCAQIAGAAEEIREGLATAAAGSAHDRLNK